MNPIYITREDKPDNGVLVAQVTKELNRLEGGVNFVTTWLDNQVGSLINQLDLTAINEASVLDRDLIAELISNYKFLNVMCYNINLVIIFQIINQLLQLILLVREAGWREDQLCACFRRLKRLGDRINNDIGRTKINDVDKEILDGRIHKN